MTTISRNYNNLESNLNMNYDISSIRGTTDQSSQLKKDIQKQIEKYIKEHPPSGGTQPPHITKTKDLKLKNLINEPRITIQNNEDINKFVEKIKEKLEDEFKNTEEININL